MLQFTYNKMNNYMLLQSKNMKVSLLSKDGIWKTKLAGNDIKFDASIERYFAYLIFGTRNFGDVSTTLRMYNKHISPPDIDQFIEDFKSSHLVTEVGFDVNLLPTYATDKQLLHIPNPFSYDVVINVEQEQELLDILRNIAVNRKVRLEWWFDGYIRRYGLIPKYKRDYEGQEQELAMQFCRQYGVDINTLYSTENRSKKTTRKTTMKPVSHVIKWYSIAFVSLMVYIYIFVLLIRYESDEFYWWSFLVNTIGWLMIGIPLYLIFGRK